jgi:hypothetical protein
MNRINYSPVDDDVFVTCHGSEIQLYVSGRPFIYANLYEHLYGELINWSDFSHDGEHLINIYMNKHHLNIIKMDDLSNNIYEPVFTFFTDGYIHKCIVSPNKNQIAIIYTAEVVISDSLIENIQLETENQNKWFVRVYDFTTGVIRLVFENITEYPIELSLSITDTIAIAGPAHGGLSTYDLNTSDLILNNLADENILFIKYFPDGQYIYFPGQYFRNPILIIIKNNGTDNVSLAIVNEQNLEIIFRRNLGDIEILNIDIARDMTNSIALASSEGLYILSTVDSNLRRLFHRNIIGGVSFSRYGLNIGITIFRNMMNVINERPSSIKSFNLQEDQFDFEMDLNEDGNSESDSDDDGSYDEDNEDRDYEDEIPWPENDEPNPAAWDEEEERELDIEDPDLDINNPYQPTNLEKLAKYSDQNCFDSINMSEEVIGDYLSSDPDNLVIFYRFPASDGFLANCLTFETLKKYLKDPKYIFYNCVEGKRFEAYHNDPPQYLKIPGRTTLYVSYQDMKRKYIERQNMIFLDYDIETVKRTISYSTSITLNFVSGNHCQEGSSIQLYRIIF